MPTDNGIVLEEETLNTFEEAKEFIHNKIQEYYFFYVTTYGGVSIGPGFFGSANYRDGAWNYDARIQISDISIANAFWAYCQMISNELSNLEYKTDNFGGYPANRQCTQLAGAFFYDVYGFAAVRGNGVNVADNIVKDCGKEGTCPVTFEYGMGPAPGAIVSFYPNHVAVVNEVKSDGTVVISHGNIRYNGMPGMIDMAREYSSLDEFATSNGLTIKNIAIPKNMEGD